MKRKGTRLGYGSYHDHSGDGVEYGNRQSSGGLKALDGRPSETESVKQLKEFKETVVEYIPAIPLDEHPVIPCTVLDPFIGSGTTAIVALKHGRRAIGIDLSEKYLRENAVPRIKAFLNARPDLRHLIELEVKSRVFGRRVGG